MVNPQEPLTLKTSSQKKKKLYPNSFLCNVLGAIGKMESHVNL